MVAALAALHAKNLVHEHIDAAAILAVGETVKLRTDCVRECVVEPGFTTAEDCMKIMERDVHDLAVLLLQALTLEKKLSPSTKLPAPFDRIVANGMNGAWGLREIAEALAPAAAVVQPALSPIRTSPLADPAPSHSAATLEDESVPDTMLYQRRNHIGTVQVRQRGPLWAAGAVIAVIVLAVFLRAGISKPANEPQSAAPPAAAPARQAVVKQAPTPIPPAGAQ
jgi:eukaryotic-like serine/threonine-protein kinase